MRGAITGRYTFLIGGIVIAMMALPLILSVCTLAKGAEQGPAGSALPSSCGPHNDVIEFVTSGVNPRTKKPYAEEVWRMKTAHKGDATYVVEWMENSKTGTWTLLVSRAGLTCVLLSGGREPEENPS